MFFENSVGNSGHNLSAERQLGGVAPKFRKMRGVSRAMEGKNLHKSAKKFRKERHKKPESGRLGIENVSTDAETMRDRFSSVCSANPARFQRLTTSQSRVMNFSKQVLISGILCSCTYFQFSSHSQNLESTGALGLSVVQADVRTVCFATGRPGCGPNFHPNF